MPEEKPQPEVRVPRQRRSRERVESILEAAKALIGEKGSAGLKIQEIADRAGVTAGSMYQYFPNKAAILHDLAEQYVEQFHQLLQTSLTKRPKNLQECAEVVHLLFDQFYQVNRDDPVLRDIWLSISADKTLREMDHRGSQRNADMLFEFFKDLFPEQHWPDVRRYFLTIVHITPPIIRLALSADPDESLEFIRIAKRIVTTSLPQWDQD